MSDYINLSHNDLDGVGCNIVLREKFKHVESYHVSYNDISETLKYIGDDINHLTKVLFVTDLAFGVEDFNTLMGIAEANPDLKIVYVDHHPYDESEELFSSFEELSAMPNVFVKHRIGTSATKLCFEMIKSENEDLRKLVDWIDAFDIFKQYEEPQNFKIGWFLNTIFWEVKAGSFKMNIIKNGYKIPDFFKRMYKEIIEDKNKYFDKQKENGLVVFDEENSILLAFCDKYKSFWQMDHPDYEFYILPYHLNGRNISIRINSSIDDEWANIIKTEVVDYVKKSPWVISSGGHNHAFGITIDKNMPEDDYLSLVSGIIEILENNNYAARIPF